MWIGALIPSPEAFSISCCSTRVLGRLDTRGALHATSFPSCYFLFSLVESQPETGVLSRSRAVRSRRFARISRACLVRSIRRHPATGRPIIPELPDIAIYLERLDARIAGRRL